MKTAATRPSSSRRLLACCGFAACWLGAAVTGFQANVGDDQNRNVRVERPAPAPIERVEEPQDVAPTTPRAPTGMSRTAIREYWR